MPTHRQHPGFVVDEDLSKVPKDWIRISPDVENDCADWWYEADHSPTQPPVWPKLREHFVFSDTAYCSKEEARKLYCWASSLPEWDSGPTWAPCPLLFYAWDTDDQNFSDGLLGAEDLT